VLSRRTPIPTLSYEDRVFLEPASRPFVLFLEALCVDSASAIVIAVDGNTRPSKMNDVTRLVVAIEQGNIKADDELLPFVARCQALFLLSASGSMPSGFGVPGRNQESLTPRKLGQRLVRPGQLVLPVIPYSGHIARKNPASSQICVII